MPKGRADRSTRVTFSVTNSAPKRVACSRNRTMSSGPMIPSGKPGKFSTSVVSISWPPGWSEVDEGSPSMTSGARLARAAYTAAVSPAGPDPMMITSRTSADSVIPRLRGWGTAGTAPRSSLFRGAGLAAGPEGHAGDREHGADRCFGHPGVVVAEDRVGQVHVERSHGGD